MGIQICKAKLSVKGLKCLRMHLKLHKFSKILKNAKITVDGLTVLGKYVKSMGRGRVFLDKIIISIIKAIESVLVELLINSR